MMEGFPINLTRCSSTFFTPLSSEVSVESAAKWASVIGGIGIFVCFSLSSYFLSSWGSAHDDVDWNDWVVYEVEGDEATLFLDEDVGYTIYVEDTHSCSEVTAKVYFEGEDYYDENCDPYYDFDDWIQIGDIVNWYSGNHQVQVIADSGTVERFIIVDWTSVEGNSFEFALLSGVGCCASLLVLVIGLILTGLTEKKSPATPQFVRDSSGHYSNPGQASDGQAEGDPSESDSEWWN